MIINTMVRINLVNPEDMHYRHLMAERYEILEIPRNIKSWRFILENIPEEYKIGEGHKKFFYNKLLYLKKRYIQLHEESLSRGFEVKNFSYIFDELDILFPELYKDYKPTQEEYNTSLEVLRDRIRLKPEVFWEFHTPDYDVSKKRIKVTFKDEEHNTKLIKIYKEEEYKKIDFEDEDYLRSLDTNTYRDELEREENGDQWEKISIEYL